MESSLTTFARPATDSQKIFDAVVISVVFIAICWFAFLAEEYLGYHFRQYGLEPRTAHGLTGIFSMHFLHSDWKHIGQNSLGFLVLNTFLFYFYREISFKTFFWIFLISPILLWLFGRGGNHIGASVILYGEFGFLATSGLIRRNPLLMRVALVVLLYYGSLVWYIFPVDSKISWEGHASGIAVGILLSLVYRNQGPKRKVYQFELDPELPDDENAYWKIPGENQGTSPEIPKQDTTVTVRYHYKEKEDRDTSSITK